MKIAPIVRHMLICRECDVGEFDKRVTIFDWINGISIESFDPHEEWNYDLLCVALMFRGGRGNGLAQVSCLHEEKEKEIFASPPSLVIWPENPLEYQDLIFKFTECWFPAPGSYVMRFWYNEDAVMDLPFVVKEMP